MSAVPVAVSNNPTLASSITNVYKFHAIRQCDSLKSAAIFTDWEDCSFYIEESENDGTVEYQSFDGILQAENYIRGQKEYQNISSSLLLLQQQQQQTKKPPPPAPAAVAVAVAVAPKTNSNKRSANMASLIVLEQAESSMCSPAKKKQRPSARTNYSPSVQCAEEAELDLGLHLDSHWQHQYDLLQKYHAMYSHVNVNPHDCTRGKPFPWSLYTWVQSQRYRLYRYEEQPKDNNNSKQVGGSISRTTVAELQRLQRLQRLGMTPEKPDGKIEEEEDKLQGKKPAAAPNDVRRGVSSLKNRPPTPPPIKAGRRAYAKRSTAAAAAAATPTLSIRQKKWQVSFQLLQEYKKELGDVNVSAKICGRSGSKYAGLYRWINSQRSRKRYLGKRSTAVPAGTSEELKQLEVLGVDLDESIKEARWYDWYRELLEFQKEHGHCDVPKKHLRLNGWVLRMRTILAKIDTSAGTCANTAGNGDDDDGDDDNGNGDEDLSNNLHFLTPSQIEKLRALNLKPREIATRHTLASPNAPAWEEMFRQLADYKRDHGTLQVPHSPKSPLRNWIILQRTHFDKMKQHKKSPLTHGRIAKLTELGFFFIPSHNQLPFEERAVQWLAYKTNHGGKDPSSGSDDHATLGMWCQRMRREYRKHQKGEHARFSQAQFDQLSSWGFRWETGFKRPAIKGPQKKWEERFTELMKYGKIHGHVDVPQACGTLGNWVHRQRKEYTRRKLGKKSTLTDGKMAKLKEVGFRWITRKRPVTSPAKDIISEDEEDYTDDDEPDRNKRHNRHHVELQQQAQSVFAPWERYNFTG